MFNDYTHETVFSNDNKTRIRIVSDESGMKPDGCHFGTVYGGEAASGSYLVLGYDPCNGPTRVDLNHLHQVFPDINDAKKVLKGELDVCGYCDEIIQPSDERSVTGSLISSNLYAVHTPDGAPMNETALCGDCIGDSDLLYPEAEAAEDRPEVIEWMPVERPGNNDTVCVSCGATDTPTCPQASAPSDGRWTTKGEDGSTVCSYPRDEDAYTAHEPQFDYGDLNIVGVDFRLTEHRTVLVNIVTAADLEHWGWESLEAYTAARGHNDPTNENLDEWVAWAEGDVYTLITEQVVVVHETIQNLQGEVLRSEERKEWREIESCGGYYGYDYALSSAGDEIWSYNQTKEATRGGV